MKIITGVFNHTKTGTGHEVMLSLHDVPGAVDLSIMVTPLGVRSLSIAYERAGSEIDCSFSVPAQSILKITERNRTSGYTCIYDLDAMRARKLYSRAITLDMRRTVPSNAPAPGKLFTLGYVVKGADERIQQLASAHCLIADIRLKPDSQIAQWNRKALQSALGVQYAWLEECGNVNYKTPGNIQLLNGQAGANIIADYLRAGYDVCLLCKCVSPVTCHRRAVASLLREQITALEVINL